MKFGMRINLRSIIRFAGVASLLLTLAGSTAQPTSAPAARGESPTTRINPEVRLRKLHLVRPDLIPYPIMYEVYC